MNDIDRMKQIEKRLVKLFPKDFIKTQICRLGFAEDIYVEYYAVALERDGDNYHFNVTSTNIDKIESALDEAESNTPLARLNTVLAAVKEARAA